MNSPDREGARRLLEDLVTIPSPSGEEGEASHFLAQEMERLAFDRAYVDEAGNAIGEMGPRVAERLLILLGHIDTVPGTIPVRRQVMDGHEVLFGRGSVDAKGPLAAFVTAVARLGSSWAEAHRLRVVVAGAVEEEAATSRGARFLVRRFDGGEEPVPNACVIGEPSDWQRLTLGYKGRLLVELAAERELAHTAGPDPGVATLAVELWNWLSERARIENRNCPRAFEQLQPSLRRLSTDMSDPFFERVEALYGLRLPPGFDSSALQEHLLAWAGKASACPAVEHCETSYRFAGQRARLELAFRGYEPAWRGTPHNALVRAFLASMRRCGADRPRFLVKTGTSDMNVVGPRWQCPILAYGAGDSRLDHTPNEHLNLEEYGRAIQVLEGALEGWATTG